MLDQDGHMLGAFLVDALSWTWSPAKAKQLIATQVQATLDLADTYPPPMPGQSDIRHPDLAAERRKLEKDGQPHGIWHLGLIGSAHNFEDGLCIH